jgi:acyl carrier protein
MSLQPSTQPAIDMPIQERVKRFIAENFYVPDALALGDDVSLITDGYVDSTGMLEVIAFLETTYEISIEQSEITPANLETLGNIARFVGQKLADSRASRPS